MKPSLHTPRITAFAAWLFFCLPAIAVAQVTGSASGAQMDKDLGLTSTNSAVDGLGWQLLQTLLVLGLVLALIYLSLNFGLRRLLRVPSAQRGMSGTVVVLEKVPLEPKRSLYVVRAANEYWLLGSSEAGIHSVAKLDGQEVERLRKEAAARPLPFSPFLQKLLARKDEPPPTPRN